MKVRCNHMNIELLTQKRAGIDETSFRTQLVGDEYSPFHTHTFFEFFYITTGSVKHYFNGETLNLTVGDLYLIKPGDTHMFFTKESHHTHRDILISPQMWQCLCDFIHCDLSNMLLPSQQKINITNMGVESFENLLSHFNKISADKSTPPHIPIHLPIFS